MSRVIFEVSGCDPAQTADIMNRCAAIVRSLHLEDFVVDVRPDDEEGQPADELDYSEKPADDEPAIQTEQVFPRRPIKDNPQA